MKITLTAKLKLRHTPEQKAALDAVTLAYRDALNFASEVAHGENKMSQAAKLQKMVYEDLREKFGLPSQMACNAPRQVASSYKVQWTKFRQNQAARDLGHTKRRYKGLDHPCKFVSRTLTYNFGRDYSWKKNQQVSVQTLEGRQVIPYDGYSKHLAYIQQGCEVGAAKLYYQKSKKQYYLLVSLDVDIAEPRPEHHKQVIGVDVGQRYHAVVSNTRNHALFQSGKQARQRKDHFARLRQHLQRKGTRSATRRLTEISGRERRFIADWNHKLSQRILRRFPHAFIGLEDLTNIRDRTEGRNNPKATKKVRTHKRRRSQWSFAELQSFLAYKAPLNGSMTVKVDANYTSQACTCCGHTSKGNRPKAGLMFVCENCGYEVHSDLLGSRNIALRALVSRQDWEATGCLSTTPDVTHAEAKTVRLLRYAGLRWSAVANPDQTL
ncbi:RNA-guided endonuclease InsQ/TnpB family protein [Deinococcus roseus]|uniref:Transposase n=1 Tax=Deinococcus roseus TaxID=392414 RepID=A0ABQ2D4K0_9DEIO|nr:RNA-guided endonuclease TnpB family protein [Deinococcus roseus]GGJ45861.1 transposase [Deinococcus roseus]